MAAPLLQSHFRRKKSRRGQLPDCSWNSLQEIPFTVRWKLQYMHVKGAWGKRLKSVNGIMQPGMSYLLKGKICVRLICASVLGWDILFRNLKIDAKYKYLETQENFVVFTFFFFKLTIEWGGKNHISLFHLFMSSWVVSCVCPDQEWTHTLAYQDDAVTSWATQPGQELDFYFTCVFMYGRRGGFHFWMILSFFFFFKWQTFEYWKERF